MSTDEVCQRIEHLTTEMMSFWKSAEGWVPIETAGILNKSALEWQSSLSNSLHRWIGANSEGDLILAWANLGALVEGQLKLFLSVYYNDYKIDAEAIKGKKGKLKTPDECSIEPLRQFFVKRIWTNELNWDEYVQHVQNRRNAIHAFKFSDIGTHGEWNKTVADHLAFIKDINYLLPYPDESFVPREK